jgi:hypothetical protein
VSTKESVYWQDKLDEQRRTQLDVVRATAAKWQATVATLLGIFGSVAFVGGVTTVDELDKSDATQAKALVGVAVFLALMAVLAAAYASMGVPRRKVDATWQWLQRESSDRASRALVALRVSQVLAIAAAACVVGGSLKLLLDSSPKASTDPHYIVTIDGAAWCGRLVAEGDVLKLETETGTTVDLTKGLEQLIVVDACPKS